MTRLAGVIVFLAACGLPVATPTVITTTTTTVTTTTVPLRPSREPLCVPDRFWPFWHCPLWT